MITVQYKFSLLQTVRIITFDKIGKVIRIEYGSEGLTYKVRWLDADDCGMLEGYFYADELEVA